MRIAKNDVPVKIDVPGATARQVLDFGDASGYGKMAGEYFSFGAGTDIAPLLEGLESDMGQSPHWGYVIEGQLAVKFGDGAWRQSQAGTCSTGRPATPCAPSLRQRWCFSARSMNTAR